MSQETYEALEAAIRAHIADEHDGAYLTHWHVVAAGAVPEDPDRTAYSYVTHDGAPHEWWGLLHMAERRAGRWQDSDQGA